MSRAEKVTITCSEGYHEQVMNREKAEYWITTFTRHQKQDPTLCQGTHEIKEKTSD